MFSDDRQTTIFDVHSIEAARSIDAAEIRKRVLEYIRSCGEKGAICDEVEQALKMSHQTASARCTELKAQKLVEVRGSRKTRSGRSAGVLIARTDVNFWREE